MRVLLLILGTILLPGCNQKKPEQGVDLSNKVKELEFQIESLAEIIELTEEQRINDSIKIDEHKEQLARITKLKLDNYVRLCRTGSLTLTELVFLINHMPKLYENLDFKAEFGESLFSADIFLKGLLFGNDLNIIKIRREYKYRDGHNQMVDYNHYTRLKYLGVRNEFGFKIGYFGDEVNLRVIEVKDGKKTYEYREPPFDTDISAEMEQARTRALETYRVLRDSLKVKYDALNQLVFANVVGVPTSEELEP
ncbi:hypothetical protein ACFL5V_03960 [Fibrobacterota bacterium]